MFDQIRAMLARPMVRLSRNAHICILLGLLLGFVILPTPIAWLIGCAPITVELFFIVPGLTWLILLRLSRVDLSHTAPSFMELYMSGEVDEKAVDDFIDHWSESRAGSKNHRNIHTYLGMTYDEYCRWVADPSCLPEIRRMRATLKNMAIGSTV